MAGYRIGIDVGGTFTDFLVVDPDGSLTLTNQFNGQPTPMTEHLVDAQDQTLLHMTTTDPLRPVVTKTFFPSGETAMPMGRTFVPCGAICLTILFSATSATQMTPPDSQVMYALAPSAVNATPRGRCATLKCATISLEAVSMT